MPHRAIPRLKCEKPELSPAFHQGVENMPAHECGMEVHPPLWEARAGPFPQGKYTGMLHILQLATHTGYLSIPFPHSCGFPHIKEAQAEEAIWAHNTVPPKLANRPILVTGTFRSRARSLS